MNAESQQAKHFKLLEERSQQIEDAVEKFRREFNHEPLVVICDLETEIGMKISQFVQEKMEASEPLSIWALNPDTVTYFEDLVDVSIFEKPENRDKIRVLSFGDGAWTFAITVQD